MKKVSLKGKVNEILKAHALFVICINVPALHPCYMTNFQEKYFLVVWLCNDRDYFQNKSVN